MIEAASKSKFRYDQSTLILLRVNIGVIDRTIIIAYSEDKIRTKMSAEFSDKISYLFLGSRKTSWLQLITNYP